MYKVYFSGWFPRFVMWSFGFWVVLYQNPETRSDIVPVLTYLHTNEFKCIQKRVKPWDVRTTHHVMCMYTYTYTYSQRSEIHFPYPLHSNDEMNLPFSANGKVSNKNLLVFNFFISHRLLSDSETFCIHKKPESV